MVCLRIFIIRCLDQGCATFNTEWPDTKNWVKQRAAPSFNMDFLVVAVAKILVIDLVTCVVGFALMHMLRYWHCNTKELELLVHNR